MLVLTIVAFFSTVAFYRRAKLIGISPGRAASLPFIVLGVFFAFGFVSARLITYLGESTNVSSTTLVTVALVFDLFIILAYLEFIRRNWLALHQTDKF